MQLGITSGFPDYGFPAYFVTLNKVKSSQIKIILLGTDHNL